MLGLSNSCDKNSTTIIFSIIIIVFLFQNDYKDSFDDPKNREIGRDIKNGKVNWLSFTAYSRCNPQQKELFRENFYRESCGDSVNNLIELYKQLDIPKVYEETIRNIQNEILEDIKTLPKDTISRDFVLSLLDILPQLNSLQRINKLEKL